MFSRILLAGLASLAVGSVANAQDFTQMDFNKLNNAFNFKMNGQIANKEQSIISTLLNDPQVMAAYRQHRNQGGQSSPQQFAYWYAATCGGNPQIMAQFQANEANNHAKVANSWKGVQQAEAIRRQAQSDYMNGFHKNNWEFGHQIGGNSTYTNPNFGNHVLPHNVQPGYVHRDGAGRFFQMDGMGNYHMYNNGYWYPMQPSR